LCGETPKAAELFCKEMRWRRERPPPKKGGEKSPIRGKVSKNPKDRETPSRRGRNKKTRWPQRGTPRENPGNQRRKGRSGVPIKKRDPQKGWGLEG